VKEVRFGVIGCGAIHSTHCKALQAIDQAVLAGVYDVEPERANAAAEAFGVPAFGSLDEMFDAVDAVNLCVPSGLHSEVGIRAAKAGKHVLGEKPIDVKLDRALRLVDTCKTEGVLLGTISQHRFAPEILKIHQMVKDGAFGKLLQCDVYVKWLRTQEYYDSGDWRGTYDLDGGCLLNQAVHTIDLAQWMMGGVDSVQGIVKTMNHNIEAEDTALAITQYSCGAFGVIQATTNAYPGFAERIEINGTEGSVIIEADYIKFLDVDADAANAGPYGKGIQSQPVGNTHTTGGEQLPQTDLWDVLHKSQIEDFKNAILEGREPRLPGREAVEPLRIILSIYESSKMGGRSVPIHEMASA
jgi:predicted dehydrogenase